MNIKIIEEPFTKLATYATIPIAFEVASVYQELDSANGIVLNERVLPQTYIKDYDAMYGNHPTDLAKSFDLTNWSMLVAMVNVKWVGGAIIAFSTPGVDMLEGRDDLAVLWDIRVAPEFRGSGIGKSLFAASEAWARSRGCSELKIETQNNNVPACKFYQSQGCELHSVNRGAYPELPDEIQLLWCKKIGNGE